MSNLNKELKKRIDQQRKDEDELIRLAKEKGDKEKFNLDELCSLWDISDRWGRSREEHSKESLERLERRYWLYKEAKTIKKFAEHLTQMDVWG